MSVLIASILALLAGPLFFALASQSPRAVSFVDGLVLTSIAGLVFLFVLPDAWRVGGALSLLFLFLGILFPVILERGIGVGHGKTHRLMLVLGVVGLVFHTLLDGLTIGSEAHHHDIKPLSLAVVLHRFPVGLAVWSLIRPHGRRWAWGVLAIIVGGTLLGYGVGEDMAGTLSALPVSLFQAFVGGSLLHVVLHSGHGAPKKGRSSAAEGVGALVGGLGLFWVMELSASHGHQHHGDGYLERLFVLMLESGPPLLLGFVLAGFLGAAWKLGAPNWLRRGGPLKLAAKGMVVGLPLPICSCGVVPIYDRLIRAGVPPAAAAAFLIATPEIGIESLLLSIPLLGFELTLARLLAAAGLALLVGWVMGRVLVSPQATGEAEPARFEMPSVAAVLRSIREVVDDTAAWIVAGVAVAAVFEPASFTGLIASLPWGADVLVFALLGIPIYVCASGATPLAAAFIFAGVSPGAALAFLLAGPATNMTTFGVLTSLHGKRIALAFGGLVFGLAVAIGLSVNAILPNPQLPDFITGTEEYSWLSWLGLVGVTLLFVDSVLRLGPRRLIGTLSVSGTHHDHSHDSHGEDSCGDCGHDQPVPSPKPKIKILGVAGHVHGPDCDHDH